LNKYSEQKEVCDKNKENLYINLRKQIDKKIIGVT